MIRPTFWASRWALPRWNSFRLILPKQHWMIDSENWCDFCALNCNAFRKQSDWRNHNVTVCHCYGIWKVGQQFCQENHSEWQTTLKPFSVKHPHNAWQSFINKKSLKLKSYFLIKQQIFSFCSFVRLRKYNVFSTQIPLNDKTLLERKLCIYLSLCRSDWLFCVQVYPCVCVCMCVCWCRSWLCGYGCVGGWFRDNVFEWVWHNLY